MSDKVEGGNKMQGCMCYDSCCAPQGRNFLTKEEKIEMLKEYKEYLEKETAGVTEKVKELEKK
jgi:hypothetical protein